jgi:hypothetical protein
MIRAHSCSSDRLSLLAISISTHNPWTRTGLLIGGHGGYFAADRHFIDIVLLTLIKFDLDGI